MIKHLDATFQKKVHHCPIGLGMQESRVKKKVFHQTNKLILSIYIGILILRLLVCFFLEEDCFKQSTNLKNLWNNTIN